MRTRLLGLLCLSLLAACGGDTGPRSSLQACSFDQACQDPEERCNISQECGPPVGSELSCREEKGDRKCHRACETSSDCGPGESCQSFPNVNRTDMLSTTRLCYG
ncbi:hypothetical protein MFUL124B02_13725 [Myxococcus fulvus 124B02]|nr:hypothetical protein MFUL124B02_13725 [Myxococcus fulvus 124B02]